MSYHCGIGPRLGAMMGTGDRDPYVKCDGCGVVKHIGGNIAPAWLLDNKAPPGWKLVRGEIGGYVMRADYCPMCKAKR